MDEESDLPDLKSKIWRILYIYNSNKSSGLCAFMVGGVRVILLEEGRRRTLVDAVS